MRDEKPLFEVLDVALEKLNSCQCEKQYEKDGCYKCIYAYKNNFDRPLISKRKAIEVIQNILTARENIKKVESVSDVNSDSLSESVLEELFMVKLKNICSNWKPIITSRGHSGYLFEIIDKDNNKYTYEIEQQVELTQEENVQVYSKADFVIYPIKNKDMKPIAIFTDGFAFHEDRVDIDSSQRMAIVKSSNYLVWSLTWEDINEYDKKKSDYKYENYFNEKHLNIKQFRKLYKENKEFLQYSNMELLLELLTSNNINIWNLSSTKIKLK